MLTFHDFIMKILVYFFIIISGERLSDKEVDDIVKDCADAEDEDGFIPYSRK